MKCGPMKVTITGDFEGLPYFYCIFTISMVKEH